MANTTLVASAGWSPDETTMLSSDALAPALYHRITTVSGEIEGDRPALHVIYVDDAEASFTAEGAEIDTDHPTLSQALVHTGKISLITRVSSEILHQDTNTKAALLQSFNRSIIRKADEALISQEAPVAPANAPTTGLIHTPGIQTADPVSDSLDPLADLVGMIEGAGGTADAIVVAPDVWAAMRKMKTSDGSAVSLLGAGTADVERRLLGVEVITSAAVPAGTGLVIDRTAVVSAVGPLRLAMSEDVYFDSDSVGLRGTWRVGHAVVNADRIGKFELEA